VPQIQKRTVILKLDFEKAFDKVEHEVILQDMTQKEFGDRWINWIKGILSTDTSSVLPNGVPGKKIIVGGGLGKGTPYPLFYLF
jgi:hypothetical protein